MSFSSRWSRRAFLRASFLVTLALCSGQAAWAREMLEEGLPVGELSLFNTHTEERLKVTYRNRLGEYDLGAIEALNWLLRCHYTDEVTEIDIRTLEYLSMVDRKLGGGNEIHIVSGYRSPQYNDLLRKKGSGVAKRSLHLEGRAIDLRVPAHDLGSVKQAALALQYGGVGYYPARGSQFVHIDSGQFRHW